MAVGQDPAEYLILAGATLEQNLKRQLGYSYFPKSYYGVVKPVNSESFGGAHPKKYRGELANSVEVYTRVGNNANASYITDNDIISGNIQFVIDFGANDYWYYVDQGRQPGAPIEKRRQTRSRTTGRFGRAYTYTSYTKMPPLKDIQQWVETKPALVGDLSVNTRTYLAMRSIARDGIGGINFVQNAIDDTIQDLAFQGGQFISEWFQQTIENIPIIKQGKTKLYDLGNIG